jgi:hypothetical protein
MADLKTGPSSSGAYGDATLRNPPKWRHDRRRTVAKRLTPEDRRAILPSIPVDKDRQEFLQDLEAMSSTARPPTSPSINRRLVAEVLSQVDPPIEEGGGQEPEEATLYSRCYAALYDDGYLELAHRAAKVVQDTGKDDPSEIYAGLLIVMAQLIMKGANEEIGEHLAVLGLAVLALERL